MLSIVSQGLLIKSGDVPKWLKGLHSKSSRAVGGVDRAEPLDASIHEPSLATIFPEMLTVC